MHSQQALSLVLKKMKKGGKKESGLLSDVHTKFDVVIFYDTIKPGVEVCKWYTLCDSKQGEEMGKVEVSLRVEFVNGTADNGTHPILEEFNASNRVPEPLEIVKKNKRTFEQLKGFDRLMKEVFIEPNHRVGVDLVIPEDSTDELVEIASYFRYRLKNGVKGLSIECFLQEPNSYALKGKWISHGIVQTEKGGKAVHKIPREHLSKPGRSRVECIVLNDHTHTRGNVWTLPRGVKAIVYDIDGTLTIGDSQIIATLLLEQAKVKYDGIERNGARFCCKQWFAKGYLNIYLSGRSGTSYLLTYDWMKAHNFPPGTFLLFSSCSFF